MTVNLARLTPEKMSGSSSDALTRVLGQIADDIDGVRDREAALLALRTRIYVELSGRDEGPSQAAMARASRVTPMMVAQALHQERKRTGETKRPRKAVAKGGGARKRAARKPTPKRS